MQQKEQISRQELMQRMHHEQMLAEQKKRQQGMFKEEWEIEQNVMSQQHKREVRWMGESINAIVRQEFTRAPGLSAQLSHELADLFLQAGLYEHVKNMHPDELKAFLVKSETLKALIHQTQRTGRAQKLDNEVKQQLAEEFQEALQGQ